MRQSVQGLSPLVTNEAPTAALNSDMNYGNIVAFAQAIENHKLKNKIGREGRRKARSVGNFGNSFGGDGQHSLEGHQGHPSLLLSLLPVHLVLDKMLK